MIKLLKDLRKSNFVTLTLGHIDGMPTLIKGDTCIATLGSQEDTAITFNIIDDDFKNIIQTIKLPFEKLSNIGLVTQTDVINSSKNVVGRSVAGGLFFGGLGAIIGGMSAMTPKRTMSIEYYIVLNYYDNQQSLVPISFNVNYLAQVKQVKSFVKICKSKIVKQDITL